MILVISMVGILGSFAIPMVLETVGNAAARMDLQRAMISIRIHKATRLTYPASLGELRSATGFSPSRGVTFSTFEVVAGGDAPTVHMDARHEDSDRIWHASFPQEGETITPKEPEATPPG